MELAFALVLVACGLVAAMGLLAVGAIVGDFVRSLFVRTGDADPFPPRPMGALPPHPPPAPRKGIRDHYHKRVREQDSLPPNRSGGYQPRGTVKPYPPRPVPPTVTGARKGIRYPTDTPCVVLPCDRPRPTD